MHTYDDLLIRNRHNHQQHLSASDNSTWINLGQEIIGNIPTTQYSRMSGFTQTAYRYHRMRVEYVGGGGSRADIAELQFFVSDGAGIEGRLHGWAVNY